MWTILSKNVEGLTLVIIVYIYLYISIYIFIYISCCSVNKGKIIRPFCCAHSRLLSSLCFTAICIYGLYNIKYLVPSTARVFGARGGVYDLDDVHLLEEGRNAVADFTCGYFVFSTFQSTPICSLYIMSLHKKLF